MEHIYRRHTEFLHSRAKLWVDRILPGQLRRERLPFSARDGNLLHTTILALTKSIKLVELPRFIGKR